MTSFDISGRIVCVTGASSGIGRALASAFAQKGAMVVGVARRRDVLADWKAATQGTIATIVADLSDVSVIDRVAREAAEPFGPPDILINAAGINTRQTAAEVDLAGWQSTLDLNLCTPFFLARAMVEGMQTKGWGRILNIASLQSERAFPGGIAYGASKGGIAQLTRAMAEAWSQSGVNVNALAPGFFPTELTGPVFADPERSARNAAQTCIGRNGMLEDLVGPALFLCSPASAYVTGQILFVDGGYTAK